MSDHPIADYALLSDCQGAALVHRDGSIDWLALPRFDAPALAARLLGSEGGHWRIGVRGASTIRRRYIDGTLVLETTFTTQGGELVLRDGLAVGLHEGGHAIGKDAPHLLLREVRCVRGHVDLEMEYAPRPEYGLIAPLLRPLEGGVLAQGGASVLRLSSSLPLNVGTTTVSARARLRAGTRHGFALQYSSSTEPLPGPWSLGAIQARLADTIANWRAWSDAHQGYQGPWREQVHLSGRLLQALTYYPTGAIVAAPTTSLPESPGGDRNWDYRYTWIRDASLTLEALWVAACPHEANRFFDFLASTALTQVEQGHDMQIMFGIGGEHDLSERELPHLPGWRGSAPVRVGNGAWQQRQLDVYGELLAAAERLKDQLAERLDSPTRRFLARVADTAAAHWQEPDQGMWEMRGAPRHFLYSKLMCWVALDRAIKLDRLIDGKGRSSHWRKTRDAIRRAILAEGWSDRAGAYTQAFGSDELDAAALVMPMVGFIPADDPRMLATIDAIEARLTDPRGLVYRYRSADGLDGDEGAFLLCTFWLAHVRALAGQVDHARRIFERAAACANDLGLLAEEMDSRSGELLGNFPQAFSHIGLVNAAWAISEAEQRLG